MATIGIRCTWDHTEQPRTKDRITLHVEETDRKRLGLVLDRLAAKQTEKDQRYTIEADLTIRYRPRSLDANALMWSLYGIEANVLNAGGADPEGKITPQTLYDQDMKTIAPSMPIELNYREATEGTLARFGVKIRNIVPLPNGRCVAYIYKTSSDWDTLEMHRHIEHLFNRLAMEGVPLGTSDDVADWWFKWRTHIDREWIVLHDDTVTEAEYREANPVCEATGNWIKGIGHIHHIKSRGAGGGIPERDVPSNWLHLSPEAHALWTNPNGGVEVFLEKYPHLTNKITDALSRLSG